MIQFLNFSRYKKWWYLEFWRSSPCLVDHRSRCSAAPRSTRSHSCRSSESMKVWGFLSTASASTAMNSPGSICSQDRKTYVYLQLIDIWVVDISNFSFSFRLSYTRAWSNYIFNLEYFFDISMNGMPNIYVWSKRLVLPQRIYWVCEITWKNGSNVGTLEHKR